MRPQEFVLPYIFNDGHCPSYFCVTPAVSSGRIGKPDLEWKAWSYRRIVPEIRIPYRVAIAFGSPSNPDFYGKESEHGAFHSVRT